MILKFYKIHITGTELNKKFQSIRTGTTFLQLSEVADSFGFISEGTQLNFTSLKTGALPCIVHWKNIHFVVVYKISSQKVIIGDPSVGQLIELSHDEFQTNWCTRYEGSALFLIPTDKIAPNKSDKQQ